MALNIKNPEADRLARELADLTGESITEAVVEALEERLTREQARRCAHGFRQELRRMQERLAEVPDQDRRTIEEIMGYDEHGLPS
ncbi:MAG: type II toxin-antitoxin system VapB family antitoxin [Gemmatimonadota bacterium]